MGLSPRLLGGSLPVEDAACSSRELTGAPGSSLETPLPDSSFLETGLKSRIDRPAPEVHHAPPCEVRRIFTVWGSDRGGGCYLRSLQRQPTARLQPSPVCAQVIHWAPNSVRVLGGVQRGSAIAQQQQGLTCPPTGLLGDEATSLSASGPASLSTAASGINLNRTYMEEGIMCVCHVCVCVGAG